MVVHGVQDFVQRKAVQERFQKLLARYVTDSDIYGIIVAELEGSWSRGYDVALTWQRSPVQFWPSPLSN